LRTGLNILQHELPEQRLADGGHFECSPLYHSIILEDLLDLINLARAYTPLPLAKADEGEMFIETWQAAVQGMRAWLKTMCHPDGEISFFNDAALGSARSPLQLEDYAGRLGLAVVSEPGPGITQLAESGYIRLQGDRAVALLDVGAIGPDYLPGHAHADTLSFELSLGGQRVLVNSGTSCYGSGSERQRQRATAAHNTVVVEAENSSEVWGGFRVARRARPLGLQINGSGDGYQVSCGHDGYRRLPGKPLHQRQWQLAARALSVQDRIEGTFGEAIAYYHFHPGVVLREDTDGQAGSIQLPGGEVIHWQIERGTAEFYPSTYHPRFGVSEPNRCLAVRSRGPDIQVTFTW
jgi:uncharacterized heparinase superfamily protein